MLCLVAPDRREKEIVAQIGRPSFTGRAGVRIGYILFSELDRHCESICCLGTGIGIMERLVRRR